MISCKKNKKNNSISSLSSFPILSCCIFYWFLGQKKDVADFSLKGLGIGQILHSEPKLECRSCALKQAKSKCIDIHLDFALSLFWKFKHKLHINLFFFLSFNSCFLLPGFILIIMLPSWVILWTSRILRLNLIWENHSFLSNSWWLCYHLPAKNFYLFLFRYFSLVAPFLEIFKTLQLHGFILISLYG